MFLSKNESTQQQSTPALLAKYQQYRSESASLLSNKVIKFISKDLMKKSAKKLGLYHHKTLMFNDEQEMPILFNYIIHHQTINGKQIVDRLLAPTSKLVFTTIQKEILDAIKNACFGILAVVNLLPHGGIWVEDVLNDKAFLLIDRSLSITASIGMMIATDYWNFPNFAMTSGTGLPIMHYVDKLDEMIDRYGITFKAFSDLNEKEQHRFVTELTKYCIKNNAIDHIDYQEINSQ